MAMVANKLPNVRAAICFDKDVAALSRQHNDANILVLGSEHLFDEPELIVKSWLNAGFEGGRHQRRVNQIAASKKKRLLKRQNSKAKKKAKKKMCALSKTDPEIYEAIAKETHRQNDNIELIASENFTSPAVMEAVGSVLTNKYAEGYPGQTLVRRLRVRGHRREIGAGTRQKLFRRRARERPAAFRLAGQRGRVFLDAHRATRCWR